MGCCAIEIFCATKAQPLLFRCSTTRPVYKYAQWAKQFLYLNLILLGLHLFRQEEYPLQKYAFNWVYLAIVLVNIALAKIYSLMLIVLVAK